MSPEPNGFPDLDGLWRVYGAYREAYARLAGDLGRGAEHWRVHPRDAQHFRRMVADWREITYVNALGDLTLFGLPIEVTPDVTYPELVIVCDRRR